MHRHVSRKLNGREQSLDRLAARQAKLAQQLDELVVMSPLAAQEPVEECNISEKKAYIRNFSAMRQLLEEKPKFGRSTLGGLFDKMHFQEDEEEEKEKMEKEELKMRFEDDDGVHSVGSFSDSDVDMDWLGSSGV